jgi:hypothetical protein
VGDGGFFKGSQLQSCGRFFYRETIGRMGGNVAGTQTWQRGGVGPDELLWWFCASPEGSRDWNGYAFEVDDVISLVEELKTNATIVDNIDLWPRLCACIAPYYKTFRLRLPELFPDPLFDPDRYRLPAQVRVQLAIEMEAGLYPEGCVRTVRRPDLSNQVNGMSQPTA